MTLGPMTPQRVSASQSSYLLRLPFAVPWIAIVVIAGSLYVAWLNQPGAAQVVGSVVIACCGLLTLACRTIPAAAILISAVGGAVALALTSREYFSFWAAATALLVASAVAEYEHSSRRLPYAGLAAALLGIAGALLGPAHDAAPPLWPIAVATVAVALIAALVHWATRTRDLEVQAADYLHRAQVSEASTVELERRTTLAQELHDSLSHHLAAIAVQAEAGHVAREHEALSTIADLAREALGELEVVLFDLRAPSTSEARSPGGDLTLIDSKLAEPLRRRGATVQVEVATTGTDPTLLAAVYRVVQEALTNALRHADATAVWVLVRDIGGDVQVRVQDDGVGIDPEASSTGSGMGLSGIRARARQLGGEAVIGPAEPRGTLVDVRLPKLRA